MSNLSHLLEELCPDGVEYKTLGDVGTFTRGNGLQKKDLLDAGAGAIHYGQIFTHYGTTATETKSFVEASTAAKLRKAKQGDLVIATTSETDEDVCKAVAWLGRDEVAVSGDAYIYSHSLDARYMAYFFQSTQFQAQKSKYVTGTKVRRVNGTDLARIILPIPPADIQRVVVDTLTTMEQLETELREELEAELEARAHQYKHYRNTLLTFERDGQTEWSTLGDVSSKVSSGGTPSTGRADYYNGDIPWLRTQEVNYEVVTGTSVTITQAGLANSSANWVPADTVLVAMYGATAAKVAIAGIPLTTNQACCNLQIDPQRANYRFVFHWITHEYARLRALGEGSQSNLSAQKVKSYPIPVPPLEEQERIVKTLDSFDALRKELASRLPAEITARRKQYEYYRDLLLTFPERTA